MANPHDNENDLLVARARRLNPEKMTPELYAGYYAFAGIIERGTAARLHQHYVTWDDVGDYSGLGIGASDFNLMQVLSINGLKPADLRRWKNTLRGQTQIDPRSILKLFTLGADAQTVLAYLGAGAFASDIPALFGDYGMSVAQVARYVIGTAADGTTGALLVPAGRITRDLAAMTAKTRHRDLACELVAQHVLPAMAAGWNAHYETFGVEQCSALIRAGFSVQEIIDHPDLGSTPRDLLEIQASLAGLVPIARNSLALV